MKKIMINVKKLRANARLPMYGHPGEYGDLAADLYSVENIEFAPGEVRTICTGIAVEFPPGFGGIIADRSGLAARGFTTLGGIIDPGYRGEIKVVGANVGNETVLIKEQDRIAQIVIIEKIEAEFQEASELQTSSRAESGFGSTGR